MAFTGVLSLSRKITTSQNWKPLVSKHFHSLVLLTSFHLAKKTQQKFYEKQVKLSGINPNTNGTGERPTLQANLHSYTSKHSRRTSKSPTRKAWKISQQNQSNKIAALKAEIEELKQQKQNRNNTKAKTNEETDSNRQRPTGKSRMWVL